MAGLLKGCDEWKPFIAMLTVDFAFSIVNILLEKVLNEGINHLVLITYRLSISAAFLGPIGYFWERMESVNIKSNSGRAKVVGTLVCVGGAMVLTLYKGMPLFTHSHSHLQTSLKPHQAMEHIKLVSYRKRKAEKWTIGCVALGAGTLLWSSWFLLQSKIGKRYPYQYSSTAIMSFFGAIQSAVLALSTRRNLSIWLLKGKIQIITVLYAGTVGSGLCYVGMAWCVKKRGPVFTSAFSPLVQIMAALFDITILHEELHFGSLLGSIIVIVGLYILLWGKNKELQNHATKVAQQVEEVKEQELQLQVISVSCDSKCP
ncbi:hypothetical protein JCGZ_07711 [Jatropha curcas]|uniref:WAT1-related protein n=1 Tax=Jatropha curcas TaxID=180498 RepID=A0A067KPD1_JATCU|nr:hypothetical protein JCGZ_07711 [Jatropha curcas]